MRNNNTFGTSYPTGSIGRYSTEELKEMRNSSDDTITDRHNEDIENKTKNHKVKDKSER